MTRPGHGHPLRLPPAAPGLRIGLLGGSFNPAHDGHRHISLVALQRLRLDRIWWLVSPGNPLKFHGELAGIEERVAAARRLARHPRIAVTGFEADLPSPYTADTLDYLLIRLPQVRLVWLMGADNLAQLPRWQRWRHIMESVPVAVFDRPGWRHKALAAKPAVLYAEARLDEANAANLAEMAPPAWTFLSLKLSAQSSSAIRAERKTNDTSAIGRTGRARPRRKQQRTTD